MFQVPKDVMERAKKENEMLCLTCFIGGNVCVCMCVEARKKQILLTKSKELDSSKKLWVS